MSERLPVADELAARVRLGAPSMHALRRLYQATGAMINALHLYEREPTDERRARLVGAQDELCNVIANTGNALQFIPLWLDDECNGHCEV